MRHIEYRELASPREIVGEQLEKVKCRVENAKIFEKFFEVAGAVFATLTAHVRPETYVYRVR